MSFVSTSTNNWGSLSNKIHIFYRFSCYCTLLRSIVREGLGNFDSVRRNATVYEVRIDERAKEYEDLEELSLERERDLGVTLYAGVFDLLGRSRSVFWELYSCEGSAPVPSCRHHLPAPFYWVPSSATQFMMCRSYVALAWFVECFQVLLSERLTPTTQTFYPSLSPFYSRYCCFWVFQPKHKTKKFLGGK